MITHLVFSEPFTSFVMIFAEFADLKRTVQLQNNRTEIPDISLLLFHVSADNFFEDVNWLKGLIDSKFIS